VLRWYWWRLNGWGYAAGTLVGLLAALSLPILLKTVTLSVGPLEEGQPVPRLLEYAQTLNLPYVAFPVVSVLSIVGCLVGTWVTRPTDEATLVAFFRSVRPFGIWRPIRERSGLKPGELNAPSESLSLAAVNVVLSSIVILGAYLAPMYLVGHWYVHALICLTVGVAAAVAMYYTWYRNLPD
jgi:hypothetical protein